MCLADILRHICHACGLQDPAAADLLAHIACDPTDAAASDAAVQSAVQEYERLLGHPTTAADSSKGRANKRQKKAASAAVQQQEAVQVPPEAVPQVYRLYSGYLEERMQALLQQEEHALPAAAAAQQLFKVLLSAHAAGAADEGLYALWVRLATQLQQHKVGAAASGD
jgi:hypothetical protein